MKDRPTVITINGKEVPLWCDIYVLNEVQEEYGSIASFERKLAGIKVIVENDKKTVHKAEPEVKTIIFALKHMIKEGYRKEALLGEERAKEDVEKLVTDVDIPFNQLADMLHNEFRRCFAAKK